MIINCFYPEIIPEPDYSDSGDEDYFTDTRSALERLRELTEVYVSTVDLKKAPSKKAEGSRARPKPKTVQQAPKESRRPPTKTASKTQQPKRSPSPPSKKGATKSTSKTQQARRSPSPPSKKGATKSTSKTQQARRSPSPPSKKGATQSTSKTQQARRTPSPASKTAPPKASKPTDKSAKAAPRPKSPPSKQMSKTPPPKGVAAKPAAKGKASPEAAPKATTKEPGVSKIASPSGDTKDVVVGKTAPESTRGKSPLRSDSDDERLIKPRKPYSQQSTERMKLHQELKFSQRYGKPGPPKTELQLALERYTENKMRRELMAEEKTSLEKILELQAKKIQTQEEVPAWVERLQRLPAAGSDPETEEFFRVHARVVASNSLTHCFLSDPEKSDSDS